MYKFRNNPYICSTLVLCHQKEDRLHHAVLLIQRDAGINRMERILLEEAYSYDPCDLQYQFLVIREHITSYELYDLHQGTFIIQDGDQPVPVCYEQPAYVL